MRQVVLALTLVLAAAGFAIPVRAAPGEVVVFAAASLKNVLDEVDAEHQKATGKHAEISYAASSALAKQIENAAPADIFISADLKWMDYVDN